MSVLRKCKLSQACLMTAVMFVVQDRQPVMWMSRNVNVCTLSIHSLWRFVLCLRKSVFVVFSVRLCVSAPSPPEISGVICRCPPLKRLLRLLVAYYFVYSMQML